MNIFTIRFSLILLSYALSYYLASFFGIIYGVISPESLGGGSFIETSAVQWLAGFPLAVVFFITVLQFTVRNQNTWLWAIIASTPALFFQLVINPRGFYIPIFLAVIAWLLGTLFNKALNKLTPQFMAKIST